MREKIRSYFESLPNYQENRFPLKDDDSVIELGLIDSLKALDIIAFVEEAFGIEVEPDDITQSNFESIAAIHSFVESKLDGHQIQSN